MENSKQVLLYVFNMLSDWEPSYAIAGINDPTYQVFPERYVVKTISRSKEPIKTLGGITVIPDSKISEVNPINCALLILPGGPGWESEEHKEVLDFAKRLLFADKYIAAICGATLGLAKAGFLDEVRHTSNASVYLQTTKYKGNYLYQEDKSVTDNNIITANGTAPIEFAYQIFRILNIYTDAALEAWYGLYKTGDIKYFL